LSCHRGGHRWLDVLTGRVSGGQRRFRPLRVRNPIRDQAVQMVKAIAANY
jgi:hypothetical protein